MSGFQQVLLGCPSPAPAPPPPPPPPSPAVWNSADKTANVTLSSGDLTASVSTGLSMVRATVAHSTGDRYFEVSITRGSGANAFLMGVAKASAALTYPGDDADSFTYYSSSGQKYSDDVATAYGASYDNGDVIGVRWNATAGEIEFFKNGSSQGVAFTGVSGTLYPVWGTGSTGAGSWSGAADFAPTLPSGVANTWD